MKTPRKKIEAKLDDITRSIVRLQFKNTCAMCLSPIEGVNSQKSHVKSKGAYPHLKFDLKNLILLCYRCHIGIWHHEPTEAGLWFKHEFPERFRYLEKAKQVRTHHSVADLEDMYAKYLKVLEELKRES